MKNPKVTVLLPVYNGEKYIRESIDSILTQTFKDFELLTIIDGSSDNSENIINSYNDPRIRLLINEHNLGLIGTLNIGLSEARGGYVARMDQDDISMPDRLGLQVEFLDTHRDYGVIGGYFVSMDESSKSIKVPALLIDNDDIKEQILYKNPFAHGSIMLRKSILAKIEKPYYRPEFKGAEDYDFWSRFVNITKFYNLPNVVYKYRINPEGISATQTNIQKETKKKTSINNLIKVKSGDIKLLKLNKLFKYKNYKILIENQEKIVFGRNRYISHILALIKVCLRKKFFYKVMVLYVFLLISFLFFLMLQPIYFIRNIFLIAKKFYGIFISKYNNN